MPSLRILINGRTRLQAEYAPTQAAAITNFILARWADLSAQGPVAVVAEEGNLIKLVCWDAKRIH